MEKLGLPDLIKALRKKKWVQNMVRQALEVDKRGWGHIHLEIADEGKEHNLEASKKWHHDKK